MRSNEEYKYSIPNLNELLSEEILLQLIQFKLKMKP